MPKRTTRLLQIIRDVESLLTRLPELEVPDGYDVSYGDVCFVSAAEFKCNTHDVYLTTLSQQPTEPRSTLHYRRRVLSSLQGEGYLYRHEATSSY